MAIAQVLEKAELLFARISTPLNTVVIALVILLSGFILARIVDRTLYVFFGKVQFDDRLTKMFSSRRNYARATRVTIVRILYVLTVLAALSYLHASTIVLLVIFGIFALAALISLVLTLMDVLPNLFARAQLQQRHIGVGDDLIVIDETGVVKGKVTAITPTHVHLLRADAETVFIPNATMLRAKLRKRRAQK